MDEVQTPLIYQVVNHLAGGVGGKSFAVGQPVADRDGPDLLLARVAHGLGKRTLDRTAAPGQ